MKVLIDNQVFAWQIHGGISRYFVELHKELRFIGVNSVICAPFYVNQYLKEAQHKIGAKIRCLPEGRRTQLALLRVNTEFCRAFAAVSRPDIVHHTYYETWSNKTKGTKHVLTVYDMIHENLCGEIADSQLFIKQKHRAMKAADHIIAISESTKLDILKYTDIQPNKITTIHLASSPMAFLASDQYGLPTRDYILFVGPRTLYKNFDNYIQGCKHSQYTGRFVFFGGGAFTESELAQISDLGLSGRVLQIGGTDCTLAGLYKNADLFVYPSRAEGFGIPLLEALFQQCPVACSNIPPFKEIMLDAATYFDPNAVDSIANGINMGLNSKRISQKVLQEFQERFSWRNCAVKTEAAYSDIVR